MAVLSKSLIAAKTKDLEEYYQDLKVLLEGSPVDSDMVRYYVSRRSAADSITNINIDRLLDTIGHIKVILDSLRRLNSDAVKAAQSPYFFDEPPPY